MVATKLIDTEVVEPGMPASGLACPVRVISDVLGTRLDAAALAVTFQSARGI